MQKARMGESLKEEMSLLQGWANFFVSVLVSAHISRVRVEYSTPVSVLIRDTGIRASLKKCLYTFVGKKNSASRSNYLLCHYEVLLSM